MTTRVKVCCIASAEEARMAIEAGASALGLVSEMPSGPGPIPDERIAEIAATVPPGVATFLLTCRRDAEEIADQQRRSKVGVLQLCDETAPGVRSGLRGMLPGVKLVQVIHVRDARSIDEARAAANEVDAILLDSGRPDLPVKELGGTGRVHDWETSRAIREAVGVPVWLAGGLHPGNVAQAIATVRPFGVDLCSGIRVAGRLDEKLLASFMRAVASASARV
ncbi:MAG TPA: phosphoribosylanthranilate isomerase [Gemmatimonadota bacterium]|nr:phosphoribosylanthranilate isomerase [Gemmatimonadota bacterium]